METFPTSCAIARTTPIPWGDLKLSCSKQLTLSLAPSVSPRAFQSKNNCPTQSLPRLPQAYLADVAIAMRDAATSYTIPEGLLEPYPETARGMMAPPQVI